MGHGRGTKATTQESLEDAIQLGLPVNQGSLGGHSRKQNFYTTKCGGNWRKGGGTYRRAGPGKRRDETKAGTRADERNGGEERARNRRGSTRNDGEQGTEYEKSEKRNGNETEHGKWSSRARTEERGAGMPLNMHPPKKIIPSFSRGTRLRTQGGFRPLYPCRQITLLYFTLLYFTQKRPYTVSK